VPRIWGARSLAPLFPEKAALAEPVGEVWLTGDENIFADGRFAGRRLADAWREMPAEWRGVRLATADRFPLLVKFLFPEEKLSIQVHPDDDYAQEHESGSGGRGKTEMWYAIRARPGAGVMAGLKPGVTQDAFTRAILDGTAEECLEKFDLRAGDAVFVPAGTVHTIGAGSLLCEIQEHSDITYRVFDYNRLTAEGKPRELHIEKALAVINFGEQSGGRLEPVRLDRGGVTETYFIACRYFATEKWEFAARVAAVTLPEHFDLLVFLDGSGKLESSSGAAANFTAGEAWFLPAALGAYQLAPDAPTTLLRTYVPDIVNDFVRRLSEQNVREADWTRLVYP
jgi:mannose-6-phosphate isomerase